MLGAQTNIDARSFWKERYANVHRLERIKAVMPGIRLPDRVRIYSRQDHFVLQWWDPAEKRNLNDRVDGDLIVAIARAREIEERLVAFRSSGCATRRVTLTDLITAFAADLDQRADAGDIAPATASRYRSALVHLNRYCSQSNITQSYRHAHQVDRSFRLSLAAFLQQPSVASSDAGDRARRSMKDPGYVLDVARAMFEWAGNPDRGNLLPDGFRNPFRQSGRTAQKVAADCFGDPDISIAMAVDFINACDLYQLRLFATMLLYGLRAGEPIFVFREHIERDWLKVVCLPELGYRTKGKRDKRFPLLPVLADLYRDGDGLAHGLLFTRRSVMPTSATSTLCRATLAQLTAEFQRRGNTSAAQSSAARQTIRDGVIRAAGGLNYDQIEHEFQGLAQQLTWPRQATLKDFRHLFSTSLENAGVPEFYRRYLMGQSPGKTPIVTYTHLNQLRAQFQKALYQELAPVVEAVESRRLMLHAAAG